MRKLEGKYYHLKPGVVVELGIGKKHFILGEDTEKYNTINKRMFYLGKATFLFCGKKHKILSITTPFFHAFNIKKGGNEYELHTDEKTKIWDGPYSRYENCDTIEDFEKDFFNWFEECDFNAN